MTTNVRDAFDAIWRLTNLPFSDNDRREIQHIALTWLQGAPAQQPPPKDDYFKSLWHDQPTCECGDYVAQHENGTGRCLVCSGSQAPWDGCKQYRAALTDAAGRGGE